MAHTSGRFSLGSQGELRKDCRPRYLANRTRAGMSRGVSISSGKSRSSYDMYVCKFGYVGLWEVGVGVRG